MDPVERLALATREARFGEHGGVNPSIEVSTTFTGDLLAFLLIVCLQFEA